MNTVPEASRAAYSYPPCGPFLDHCCCREIGPTVRTPGERAALHDEAVARAVRGEARRRYRRDYAGRGYAA